MRVELTSAKVGLNTNIVQVLREYGRLRTEYLARLLGRQSEEIEDALAVLERERVIQRDGDELVLVR